MKDSENPIIVFFSIVLIVLSFHSCNNNREIDVVSDKILFSECITAIGENGKYLDMEIEKFESGKIKITTTPVSEKDVDPRIVQQGVIITEDYYIKYEEVGIKENIEEHWVFYANLEGAINSKDIKGGSVHIISHANVMEQKVLVL
ncbi:MAG TPA: hypothetical protein PLO05_00855 [Bacteroidales bacterium]|nr:hypothetical protein [Bacteroidales bacterium]MDD4234596.1 hypothetical protein [Bacteroidales bacterium]HRW20925.1 hypothetical protein [Bacteroidales bacterium]HXK80690.1 hypothetical protein [Bacteroidales bacterium]